MFGFPRAEPTTPARWPNHGGTVSIGDSELTVQHCPLRGSTPRALLR
jgi:hypothetical protein